LAASFLASSSTFGVAGCGGSCVLNDPRLYASLAIAALLILPNLVWNAQNSFATFSHTADNASWRGPLLHPDSALEFVAGQFGVFGPILFACLAMFCLRRWRGAVPTGNGEAERLLLSFCLPVLALMVVQALLSRALANWAAFAYVAATVLVTAMLIREGWTRLFRASFALHLAALLLLAVGGALAGRFVLPGGIDPYARVLGWREMAEAAGAKAEAEGYRAIATDKRAMSAELLYYLRNRNLPVVALHGSGRPRDHFELTRPLTPDTPRPVLIVGQGRGVEGAEPVGSVEVAAGGGRRLVTFFRLGDKAQ
jgi:hypothetical protein